MSLKQSQKTLFFSIITLLLCFATLAGTTYALFSDVAITQRNSIQTGTVKVNLYHRNSRMITEDAERVAVDEETALFTVDVDPVTGKDKFLWEPNASVFEEFTVVNDGTITVSYRLNVRTYGFNRVSGTGASLKDALMVAVVSDPELVRETGFDGYVPFNDFTGEVNMEFAAGEINRFYVVITWLQSSEDNRLNLKNGVITDNGDVLYIDLGITLKAVQANGPTDLI